MPRRRDPLAVRAMRDQFATDIAAGRLGIGTAVKRMREISGLTQEQFAKHRGVSLVTLRRIERGGGNPRVDTLHRIGSIFGLKVTFAQADPAAGGAEELNTADHEAAPARVELANYPQLQRLAWNRPGTQAIAEPDALALYERYWHLVEPRVMEPCELALLKRLVLEYGGGVIHGI